MTAPPGPGNETVVGGGDGIRRVTPTLALIARNALDNLVRWSLATASPPPWRMLRPPLSGIAGAAAMAYLIVASMFALDAPASAWAHGEPGWVRGLFERITDFGLSGWFLVPSGCILVALAAAVSPSLSRSARGVLAALAARFGYLFLAVGVPGLFVAIVKDVIGRARPFVGGDGLDHPFLYKPFAWQAAYAGMPSGHSTTAVAAAIAIGAVWPRARVVMWIYALLIMASRVFVLAHHPSDVFAGALTGAAGAYLLRRWFAARRLVFFGPALRAGPSPSWRRITSALHETRLAALLRDAGN